MDWNLDFDFAQFAVPFRMQPGLRRLPPEAPILTPLSPGSALYLEKQAVWRAGQSRHAAAGFDDRAVLRCIVEKALRTPHAPPFEEQLPLELAFEEDFALLDGDSATLPWLCVCVPSRWAPEEKLNQDFGAIHAPVPDNASLLSAARHLVRLVTGGDCWERHVWTITPSSRYDLHPQRHPALSWPSDEGEAFAQQCFLRVERQCFFPMAPGRRQAVFSIRVMLAPLAQAVDSQLKAQRLHDGLASMTEPVLRYKGLSTAQSRLLRWLRERYPLQPLEPQSQPAAPVYAYG